MDESGVVMSVLGDYYFVVVVLSVIGNSLVKNHVGLLPTVMSRWEIHIVIHSRLHEQETVSPIQDNPP